MDVKLRSKINAILPIVLAITLPGISMFSINGFLLIKTIGFWKNWFLAGMVIYTLWYLIRLLWEEGNRENKWRFVLILIGLLSFIVIMSYWISTNNHTDFIWHFIFRFLLASVLFMAIQFALRSQENVTRLLLEKEQIQTENYRVQLKAIRAQIDPHFLFNSLNTLRSMVRQQHGNAEKFVMSLADFYRQTLKHNENTTLSLSEELLVLESYLFLMKSRNEKAVSVKMNIDDSVRTHHLPTLALQVVVENCFKHNSMTSKMPLKIEIENTDNLYIKISNNIQPKIGDVDSSGYGLELLRKRYELMQIEEGVIVEESSEYFKVKLKLIEK